MSADFEAFVRECGLLPRRVIVADGKWHSCGTTDHPKSTNGRWKLALDGRVGWVKNWAVHDEVVTWRPERAEGASLPPPIDLAKMRRQRDQQRREMLAAMERARSYYKGCKPLFGGHPYLTAKGLDMAGCRGLKVDGRGWLVVPMMRRGELVSVQRISPEGEKLFWKDAPSRGASYMVERQGATITVLCEGLATGLALYAALPRARVIVAFNAGNLRRVAESLPRAGFTVVAADNDHGTEARIGRNPGLDAAREAAQVLGCGVAFPEGIAGTDWDDFRREKLAETLSRPLYGARKPTEANVRRAVDAQIAWAIQGAATWLSEAS